MSMSQTLEKWDSIKNAMTELEDDFTKFGKGSLAASVRLRHGLRSLQKLASEAVKASKESDKLIKEERKKERAAAPPDQKKRGGFKKKTPENPAGN